MKFDQLGGNPETGMDNPAQRSLVIQQLYKWCPILQYLEFYQMQGAADKPLKTSSATGGEERGINTAFADNVTDPDLGEITLKIYGGKIQVDDANVRRYAGNAAVKAEGLASLRLREIKKFMRRVGQNFQYAIVNNSASSDARKWNGLLNQIPTGRTVSHSDTLADNTKTAAFLEKLEMAIQDIPGGAQFILADSKVIARCSSYAATLFGTSQNELGRQVKTFSDIPIIPSGYSANGTKVLPFTSGTGSNASKVIVGRSGEQTDIACASNVGVVVKDLQLIDPFWTTKVEWDFDMDILDDESIYVIDEIQTW